MDPFNIKPIDEVPHVTVPACFLIPTDDEYINCANGYHMAAAYGGMYVQSSLCVDFRGFYTSIPWLLTCYRYIGGLQGFLYLHTMAMIFKSR